VVAATTVALVRSASAMPLAAMAVETAKAAANFISIRGSTILRIAAIHVTHVGISMVSHVASAAVFLRA